MIALTFDNKNGDQMRSKICLISLMLLMSLVFGQNKGKITGKVVDESGNPLIGANVFVIGTYVGNSTDLSGKYSIDIEPGTYTVKVQFVGYDPKTVEKVIVKLNTTTELNFQLNTGEFLSDEVVVIGYGIQKKREVTGSVTNISMKSFEKVPNQSAAAALQGQATGVNVELGSGAPYGNAQIQIRGIGTINDTDPLVIVDGVPSSMSYVDPSNIESINILKDASAAAIYGSRAANGVVIITTKRGEKNSPVKLQFKSFAGIQQLTKKYDVMNSSEYVAHMFKMYQNAGMDVPGWIMDAKTNPSKYANTDWQDAYYKDASMKKYDLSLFGGNEWINYSLSGSYTDRKGLVIRTGQEKSSLRINSDINKGKLKVGQSFAFTRINENYQSNTGWEGGYRVITATPLIPIYDKNMPGGFGLGDPSKGMPKFENPIAYQESIDNSGTYDHFLAGFYAEYEIIKSLKYKLNVGKNVYENHYYSFTHPWGIPGEVPENSLYESRSKTEHTTLENTLSYSVDFWEKHHIDLLAGMAMEKTDYRDISGGVQKLPSDKTNVISLGTKDPYVRGVAYSDRLLSQFGRFNYNYDDKYIFQFNIRRDGSSLFNEDDRYGVFPSASLGWRVSKESFFKDVPLITNLMLKGSYGVLGNNQIQRYAYFATMYTNPGSSEFAYVFGKDQEIFIGAGNPTPAAEKIKWESTHKLNFGFDLAILNDQFELSAEYFVNTTKDMLLNIPLPYSAGVWSGPIANVGEMENKGFEFSAIYKNFEGELKYSITANFSTIQNKIIKLSGIKSQTFFGGHLEWDTNPVTKTEVGAEVGRFWLYQTSGLFQSQKEVDDYNKANGYYNDNNEWVPIQGSAKAGDIKFVDVNKDGKLDDSDRVYMGSAIPDFEMGLNFNANYKNFDLNVFVHGSFGRKLFNATRWQAERMSEIENQLKSVSNSWSEQNKNTNIPLARFTDPNGNSRPSDRFLEDASYLRIRNFEIGYTIPSDFINSTGISRARVYMSVENLLTLTDYSGYDPGVGGGGILGRGVDRANYPIPRTFIFGLDLSL